MSDLTIEAIPTQLDKWDGAAVRGLKAREERHRIIESVLVAGVDYGTIPGAQKPCLLKSGAEKVTDALNLYAAYESLAEVEDWDKPLFYYRYRCELRQRGHGGIIATGIGSCNSMEARYRWRRAERLCPACGQPAIIKGRDEYGGGYVCYAKKGGCGAKFKIGAVEIEGQEIGRVDNDDVYSLVNTIDKMAQKRCLGNTVPLLIRTARTEIRTTVGKLYDLLQTAVKPIFLPGVDGTWREVLGMSRADGAVYRLSLADGSTIRATPEHRFPTQSGIKAVADIKAGDVLLRSQIDLEKQSAVSEDVAWVVGLFIADGGINKDAATAVKFTLNIENKASYANRIRAVAQSLGGTVSVKQRREGKTMDVVVYGDAFRGLIKQFVGGKDCYSKHLSRYCWRQGSAFLKALLDGYLAGDGSLDGNGGRPYWRIGFTRENEPLANDLRTLCAVLGYKLKLGTGESKCNGEKFQTWVGWLRTPTQEAAYHPKNLEEVVSNEPDRRGVVYDIEVDGDHLFCLASGIQTHNSLTAAALNLGFSEQFTQDLEDLSESGGSETLPVERIKKHLAAGDAVRLKEAIEGLDPSKKATVWKELSLSQREQARKLMPAVGGGDNGGPRESPAVGK